MTGTLVIARAYRGRPIKRELISIGNGLAYLANPISVDAIRAGEGEPVGFPLADVYACDEEIFAELAASWDKAESTNSECWNRLKRLNLSAGASAAPAPAD